MQIISGRHLSKSLRGVSSPYIEIDISGTENDSQKFKTATIPDNGFNPVWIDPGTASATKGGRATVKADEIEFKVGISDLACIRFVVNDEDVFGDSNAIAQAVFPIGNRDRPCLRTGLS